MHEQQPPKPESSEAAAQADGHEREPRLEPKIYVASLADYNNGRLHGAWLDATLDPDGLLEGIQTMLAGSAEPVAEDWAIHDHDNFAGVRIGEHESVETVSRLAKGLAEHGPAFAGLVDLLGADDATEAAFRDRYLGSWPSVTAYAEDLADECDVERHLEQLPKPIRPYVQFNAEAFGRDMQLGGEIHAQATLDGVNIFSCL